MPDEDRLLSRVANDKRVQPTLHEILRLEELKEHPGWKYQAERFKGYRFKSAQALARRLMAGLKISDDEIAFSRGYAAAIEDVFRWPERLEKDLENAALVAYERLEEGLSEEPDEEPYT